MSGTPKHASDPLLPEIRTLTAADEPLLWEMLYHAIHVPAGQEPPPQSVVRQPALSRYVEGWEREGDYGVKAVWAGTALGAAWLRVLAGQGKGYGWVADDVPELSIAVLPGHRGAGLGTRLMRGLLDTLPDRGLDISLSVSKDNRAARWYERFGFEIVADDGETLAMLRRA